MAHTSNAKEKIRNRIRRIRGQVEAIERALENDEQSTTDLMCLIAATRGAINGLMAEVMEQHVRENVLEAHNDRLRLQAAEELLEVVDSYLR